MRRIPAASDGWMVAAVGRKPVTATNLGRAEGCIDALQALKARSITASVHQVLAGEQGARGGLLNRV